MTEHSQDEKEMVTGTRRASSAIGFGTSFAAGMAIFGLGGHWLDKKLGRESLFTLIGIGLGLIYGAWELWKLVALENERSRDEERQKASNGAGSSPDSSH